MIALFDHARLHIAEQVASDKQLFCSLRRLGMPFTGEAGIWFLRYDIDGSVIVLENREWTNLTFRTAAFADDDKMVEKIWVRCTNHPEFKIKNIGELAYGGCKKVLKWFFLNKKALLLWLEAGTDGWYDLVMATTKGAIKKDCADILDILYTQRVDTRDMLDAITGVWYLGNTGPEVLNWFYEKSRIDISTLNSRFCREACHCNNITLLDLLYERGCINIDDEMVTDCYICSMESGGVDALRWLYDHEMRLVTWKLLKIYKCYCVETSRNLVAEWITGLKKE